MLNAIGSDELSEWMAFDRLDPFGEWRADLRSGILGSTVAAAHGVKDAKPSDYMPDFEHRRGRQTVAQMKDFARAWSAAFIENQKKKQGFER